MIDNCTTWEPRVVGRIVAFRDPILAQRPTTRARPTAWSLAPTAARTTVATTARSRFTNFADPEVRQYNIDLATEAAKLGFDDILYDYVRRPDGKLSTLRFPGLGDKTPDKSIADFVAETQLRVQPEGKYLGVLGLRHRRHPAHRNRPGHPRHRPHADYIAPMVYPSHWLRR